MKIILLVLAAIIAFIVNVAAFNLEISRGVDIYMGIIFGIVSCYFVKKGGLK